MIRISNITKSFGDNFLFKNLSFEFNENSRIVIQGKSGSGKTTLLKILCGLESADHGTVEKDEKCKLSYVFQQDCLFDHLTAFQNIVFGISETISKEELWNRVKRISIDTCCQEFLNQKTSTLSGGQRQRVSLASALIQFPDVVLMDEPLSHLDKELKRKMMDSILFLQEKYKFTLIYVTHDDWEAKQLGQQFIQL